MATTEAILANKRPLIWNRFRHLATIPLPKMDLTIQDLWVLGLKTGFGMGLIDGVKLGMDVSNGYIANPGYITDTYDIV